MARRIVQLLSHSIESHDMMRLYHSIGHEVFDIGPYINPAEPHVDMRPALPDVPFYPDLKAAVDELGTPDNLGAAQAHIPDKLLEWADTIVMHHYLERMVGDWPRLRDWMKGDPNRRIIWRTVGQSVQGNEQMMAPLHRDGLEIVRYSPKERAIPSYAGETALIRFYVDPDEWNGWNGEDARVIQVTQHLRQREPYTNWGFWEQATRGLNRMPLGPGSEAIGGPGALSYEDMREVLRRARCYMYTGTQPASYTLGLIEALTTGIPVISIGPNWMRIWPYSPDLFEGHELASGWTNDPGMANAIIGGLMNDPDECAKIAAHQRERAIATFGKAKIAEEWRAFLG